MSSILLTSANGVLPILLMILLGYFLRRIGMLTDGFLTAGNKLIFTVALPAMLFQNVYDLDGFAGVPWDLVAYSLIMVCVLFLLAIPLVMMVTREGAKRSVLLQCAIRSNMAIIGIPLATAIGGAAAETTAAILIAFSVASFNVLAVLSFSVFSGEGKSGESLLAALKSIGKNPLIRAIAVGMVALIIRELQRSLLGEVCFSLKRDMKFLYTAIGYLKSMTSPLALLVMGGQFVFSDAKNSRKEILFGVFQRTVFAPLLGIGVAWLLSTYTGILHCTTSDYPALVSLFGSPVAVSSAIMAGQMGGDKQLATQLVVWTSAASILTVFLTSCILMATGLVTI